jgi:hypothetical protein
MAGHDAHARFPARIRGATPFDYVGKAAAPVHPAFSGIVRYEFIARQIYGDGMPINSPARFMKTS